VRNPKSGDEIRARNQVGARIRKARLGFEPPLTQDQLAGRLAAKGISLDRVAITKIECGQRCVFDFELPPLAGALKVDVRWLLGMQNSGGPAKTGRRTE
jgi:HTH-type transcriptional regulator, cell division transcriptional repressor